MALTLSHFRFGLDSGTESTHGWHAAEDTNPASGVIALDTNFLLRFCVQANTTGLSNVDNEFQYRVNGGAWTNITTTSTVVRAVAVTPLTNGGNCTKRLSGTGTFESSGAGQTEDGTSGGTANDIVASGNSETECGLILRSADIVGGEVIEFRLTRDGGQLLNTYAVVPTLTIPTLPAELTLNVTLGALTSVATATVEVAGSVSQTLGALTASATAAVEVTGSVNQTLGALTLVATATASDPGADLELNQTLGALTCSATAEAAVTGSVSATLGELTLNATAIFGEPFYVYECGASASDLRDAVQAIMGYPASGQHIGGGAHVTIPGAPPGPGWTERYCYGLHNVTAGQWAYPMGDALIARINDPVALGALPPAQQALLLAALAGVAHLPDWNPAVNGDCAWEDP